MTIGSEARRYFRAQRYGVLATLSVKLAGYPFGSVVPYVLDHAARPVILISTIAEHTKNIDADARVSLLVHEASENVQANARLTLIGDAQRMDDQDSFKARYLRFFPAHAGYFDTHDFFFYAITPVRIRFIGGFGKIHWVGTQGYAPPANRIQEIEPQILEHMNRDHAHNLRDYCRALHGVETESAEMIGIDCDGFDVRADGRLLRFDFNQPVTDAVTARAALVELAAQCRA
jgi:putative heme iron utilization protein